jgi:hypothetical protein
MDRGFPIFDRVVLMVTGAGRSQTADSLPRRRVRASDRPTTQEGDAAEPPVAVKSCEVNRSSNVKGYHGYHSFGEESGSSAAG